MQTSITIIDLSKIHQGKIDVKVSTAQHHEPQKELNNLQVPVKSITEIPPSQLKEDP
jgi:hypothetical protein